MCETLANEFSNAQELPGNGFCCKEPSADGPLAVVNLATLRSSLPQPKDDPFTPYLYDMGNNHHLSFIRLRFDPENIKLLKDIASSESDVNDPTSFEVVAALVNKCATIAGRSNILPSSSSSFDPFTIYIPMNLRKLIDPPVQNLVGNFLSFVLIDVSSKEDLELPKLVSKIRKEKVKHMEKYQGKNIVEILAEIKKEAREFPIDSKLRLATSFSPAKLYDIDFGWGRPARATLEAIRSSNYFVMLSSPENGGVDVIASLDPPLALKFKTNKVVLDFASVDPTY
ncbi:hypothetical protein LIER_19344 [Lithospermum erythrorhizon]|uniref:Uncharacterized protein n=1 Tax=Lithospermum erythrorhizon TaxID=34254 RepID=A0AAV3QIC7_LITER